MTDDDILSDDDLATWQYVSRTITPLPGRQVHIPTEKHQIKDIPVANQVSQEELQKLVSGRQENKAGRQYQYIKHGDTQGIDKATAKRLKEGKYPVDARLDMHGRNQQEAHEGLKYFIHTAYQMGKRCVLVVTGKGPANKGKLKSNVPRWLNNEGIREYVIGFSYALPKHGGEGAIYILLKKNIV